MTDGYGCDIYIEATGAQKSVEQGLAAIHKLQHLRTVFPCSRIQ